MNKSLEDLKCIREILSVYSVTYPTTADLLPKINTDIRKEEMSLYGSSVHIPKEVWNEIKTFMFLFDPKDSRETSKLKNGLQSYSGWFDFSTEEITKTASEAAKEAFPKYAEVFEIAYIDSKTVFINW